MKVTLAHAGAARAARRIVDDCCDQAGAGPVCRDTAALLTSEVVTNALLHGQGPVRLRVDLGDRWMRVGVGDDATGRPHLPDQQDGAEGGRGMLIVDGLAAHWGVEDDERGKVVWFELEVKP